MEGLEIKDADVERAEDLISLCIPPDKSGDPLFVEGRRLKARWVEHVANEYGSCGKLAYLGSEPAGLIQYVPNPEERLIEITCIFVPKERHLRRGVGTALLQSLIEEAEEPKPYFGGKPPLALVAHAFRVPGRYAQDEFYLKRGFKRAEGDDPSILYYPLQEGYVHTPKEEKYIPLEEDMGKALVFLDPFCPFCASFAERIRRLIREVAPALSIRMINKFEERQEVERRGWVPACVVNGKPITSFFMDREGFQQEVREALGM